MFRQVKNAVIDLFDLIDYNLDIIFFVFFFAAFLAWTAVTAAVVRAAFLAGGFQNALAAFTVMSLVGLGMSLVLGGLGGLLKVY